MHLMKYVESSITSNLGLPKLKAFIKLVCTDCICPIRICTRHLGSSVSRSGYLLDFGQLFEAFGNNSFAQISHILRQFL